MMRSAWSGVGSRGNKRGTYRKVKITQTGKHKSFSFSLSRVVVRSTSCFSLSLSPPLKKVHPHQGGGFYCYHRLVSERILVSSDVFLTPRGTCVAVEDSALEAPLTGHAVVLSMILHLLTFPFLVLTVCHQLYLSPNCYPLLETA